MSKEATCEVDKLKLFAGNPSDHLEKRGELKNKHSTQFTTPSQFDIFAQAGVNIITINSILKRGLDTKYYDYLLEQMRIPSGELAAALDISSKTLYNRKHKGKFGFHESERILRYIKIFKRATSVFNGVENARRWFSTPQRALGNEKPIEFAMTEIGAREVEDLLGRIEYGVYS